MLSLPADDVTPSQTTGFILTTPGICHTVPAHVTASRYKVPANMDNYDRLGAPIQKTRLLKSLRSNFQALRVSVEFRQIGYTNFVRN